MRVKKDRRGKLTLMQSQCCYRRSRRFLIRLVSKKRYHCLLLRPTDTFFTYNLHNKYKTFLCNYSIRPDVVLFWKMPIFRKNSNSDLHSRLKTRKVLGVGEIRDDRDIYRSKVIGLHLH